MYFCSNNIGYKVSLNIFSGSFISFALKANKFFGLFINAYICTETEVAIIIFQIQFSCL